MDISLWFIKWVNVAWCLTFVSLLIFYPMVWLLLVFSKICRVVPAWGISKHMILSYFMKGMSIRCFWLLDYVGPDVVDLSNGLCFVQIGQAILDILPKNPAQGKFLISSIFDLWRQGPKSHLSFLVRSILLIYPRRVKLEPQARAQTIGDCLLYHNG